MTAAGHEYFERAPRRDGEHTGYVPIYVETTADTLEGAYIRPEAEDPRRGRDHPRVPRRFRDPRELIAPHPPRSELAVSMDEPAHSTEARKSFSRSDVGWSMTCSAVPRSRMRPSSMNTT